MCVGRQHLGSRAHAPRLFIRRVNTGPGALQPGSRGSDTFWAWTHSIGSGAGAEDDSPLGGPHLPIIENKYVSRIPMTSNLRVHANYYSRRSSPRGGPKWAITRLEVKSSGPLETQPPPYGYM